MDLLVLLLVVVVGMTVAQEQVVEPANPLPNEFLSPGLVPTVDKNQVVQALVHKVKSGAAPGQAGDDGVEEIKTASEPHMTQGEVDRLLRAVGKLNLTSEEIKLIASEIAAAQTPAQASKVRRAVEDAAVIGRPQNFPGGSRFSGFPFGGGGPPPFQFQQRGGNPFFTVPLTSPALDMDLDRLLFMATPSLGIERAFELTKLLHDQGSTRADVFKIQEQFQKNVTETEAAEILKSVEAKGPGGDPTSSSSPQRILQNTAELSGLSGHEATRFARAIGKLGELNNTQAAQIHATIQHHGLNSTELKTLTRDLETVGDSLAATTTPDSAVGGDWIFSGNGTTNKRAVSPLDSKTAMFSAVRSCGFVIERHSEPGIIIPWMATIQCGTVFCTGSLISAEVVLTSASCILACGSEHVRVLLGDNPGGKFLEVQGVTAIVNPKHASIQHPNEFDVGLIKISPPVDFNAHPSIFPVCLVGVETDDPTIECEVVVASHLQRPQFSPVRCFQPGNQLCNAASNLVRNLACAQPTNCNIPVSSQASSPVICHRTTRDRQGAVTAQRYYLWGVTSDPRQGGPSSCVHSIARVSDNYDFISGVNAS